MVCTAGFESNEFRSPFTQGQNLYACFRYKYGVLVLNSLGFRLGDNSPIVIRGVDFSCT